MSRILKLGFVFTFLFCISVAAQQQTPTQPSFRLVSSNNPSSYGDPVDFTAIFPEGTAGSVTFNVDGKKLATRAITSGQANFRTSKLELGSHEITAIYNGDQQNAMTLAQTVHRADPTVVLFCSPNWSIYTDLLECEATLPADATGTVTFIDETRPIGKIEPSEGTAKYNMPRLSAGTHLLTAAYSGDANYRPSHGRQSQMILQANSNIKVTCAPNPVYYGEAVSCTAEAPFDASGAIMFTDGGSLLAEVKLVEGLATWSAPWLAIGYHDIGASYGGDINYRGSRASFSVAILDPDTD